MNSKLKRKKYRILFISSDFNYFVNDSASFNRMYNNLLYFHNQKNFDVIVLQPEREKLKEDNLLKYGIRIYYFREIKILNYNFVVLLDFNPFFIMKVREIIKKYKIDLIHIDFVYGINSLRLFRGIPISYNAHNVESIFAEKVGRYSYYKGPKILRYFLLKYIYFLEKSAVKFVKNINAISDFDKKKFIEIYNLKKEKITLNSIGCNKIIVNNPIEKNIARLTLNIDKNKFIIIFHGSHNSANLAAINIIRKKIANKIEDRDVHFYIAGNFPDFNNEENITFLGFIENLNTLLYSADIAIAPILSGSGVKTKIIDYISAKLPIITTKHGAEGLLLKSGKHGYIVEKTTNEMVKRILDLKNNPEEIYNMKINLEKLINEYYDWNYVLKQTFERYINLIKKK